MKNQPFYKSAFLIFPHFPLIIKYIFPIPIVWKNGWFGLYWLLAVVGRCRPRQLIPPHKSRSNNAFVFGLFKVRSFVNKLLFIYSLFHCFYFFHRNWNSVKLRSSLDVVLWLENFFRSNSICSSSLLILQYYVGLILFPNFLCEHIAEMNLCPSVHGILLTPNQSALPYCELFFGRKISTPIFLDICAGCPCCPLKLKPFQCHSQWAAFSCLTERLSRSACKCQLQYMWDS